MDFGRYLRWLRIHANVAQTELGRRTGMHGSMISRLESGTREPSRAQVGRLCRALNLSEAECERLYRTAGYVYNVDVTSLENMARVTLDKFHFDADIIENVDTVWRSVVHMATRMQEARQG